MKGAFLTGATAVLVLLGTWTGVSHGDIYRYVDERGVVVYSDTPRHGGYKVHLRDASPATARVRSGEHYPYRMVVERASRMYDVDDALVRAVMEIESDYNRYAVSSTGARGLMQLMPETMSLLRVRNPWDPDQNIQAGTRYLKGLLKRFTGDTRLALAAYNAGPNAVIRYGSIPPFPETRRYVRKVMRLYISYSTIVDGR